MAHELTFTDGEANFFEVGASRSAWHRLGHLLVKPPESIEEAVRTIHADYEVAKVPTAFEIIEADGSVTRQTSKLGFSIVRTDTMAELGSVGPLYKPVQNITAFRNTLGPLVDSKLLRLETGAVLRGGGAAFLLGRFDFEQLGPDARDFFLKEKILPYVGMATDHSGSRGNFLCATEIRWVCSNTLGMDEVKAVRQERDGGETDSVSDTMATIRHTGDADQKHIDAAERLLGGIVERYEAVAKSYRMLRDFTLDEMLFERLVLRPTIGVHPKLRAEFNPEAKLADMVVERFEKRQQMITWLWTGGKGHTGDHSAWEAYNGLVEAIDHNEALFPARSGVFRLGSLLQGDLREKKTRCRNRLVEAAKRQQDGDDIEALVALN